jgi:hypothetical protein
MNVLWLALVQRWIEALDSKLFIADSDRTAGADRCAG